MNDEDRLRVRLREQVAEVAPVADLDDVAARIRRPGKARARVLTVISVAALVVGTVGGFAAGRAGRSGTAAVKVGAPGASSAPTDKAASHQSVGNAVQSDGPWRRAFVRTTTDGITMRVYLDPSGGVVTAELSTDAVAGVADDGYSPAPGDGIGNIGTGSIGVREKSPLQWVIAEVGIDATVRVRFADGGTDEMKPVNGVAVLARRGPQANATLEVLNDNGAVKHTMPITIAPCVLDSSCTTGTTVPDSGTATPPMGTLPAPGVQPADVPTARAAVTQSYAGAYDGSAGNDQRAAAIEGGPALLSVFDELRQGPVASAVLEAKTVVDEIVFVSPTRAAVKFHSVLGTADGISGPYFGDAILTAAGWQVSHDSYCQTIIPAGAHCP